MRAAWLVIIGALAALDLWCWLTGRLTLTRLIVRSAPSWVVLLGGLLVLYHLLSTYNRLR